MYKLQFNSRLRGVLYTAGFGAALLVAACGPEYGRMDSGAGEEVQRTRLAEILKEKVPGVRAEGIRKSGIEGLYEVYVAGQTAYVTPDGRFLIKGELFEVPTAVNISELHRQETRRDLLASLDDRDTIIFSPAAPEYTITAFTDLDCPYCRKMHNDIQKLNALGIAVRYAAYPPDGAGSEAWRQWEAVWCSADRHEAFTLAKHGQYIAMSACETPVAKEYELAGQIGMVGTPGVFAQDGRYLGGYLSPEQLVAKLKAAGAGKQANPP